VLFAFHALAYFRSGTASPTGREECPLAGWFRETIALAMSTWGNAVP